MNNLKLLVFLLYNFAFLQTIFAFFWFFRPSPFRYFYTFVFIASAILLLTAGFFLGKRKKWAWRLAIILIGINIIATFFDEIG